MAELTVPSLDFSPLANLGNVYTQARNDATRRQTLADLGNGTGQIDPRQLYVSGDLSLAQLGQSIQNHNDQLAQQQAATARQAERDKVADQHWEYTQKHSGDMTDYQRAMLSQDKSKPTPVETIGGTKFLVRDPNSPSGYRMIDPTQLGQPAQPQAQPAVAPVAQNQVPEQATAPQPTATPAPNAPIDPEAIDPKTGRREGYLQSLDPQVRDYIKKVADYEIDPRTTSVRGGMREKLMSAVAKYDPTYNQNDFGERAKAIKDFGTGPQGNIVRSFDVAVDHLDTLQKAATAMQNGDTRAINALRNTWREQTGSDLPTNFKALVPLVSGEIAKAVIGSNNALSDREELRSNLQAAQSPEQITGVIQGYKALMGGQLKGLKKQYEATTGKKDFDSKLRDVTKQELEGRGSKKTVIDGYTITEH